jgi:hypothetical protein
VVLIIKDNLFIIKIIKMAFLIKDNLFIIKIIKLVFLINYNLLIIKIIILVIIFNKMSNVFCHMKINNYLTNKIML